VKQIKKTTVEGDLMSLHSNDSVVEGVLQESLFRDSWEQEIVPSLPKNLEEQAWRLGAMSRKGGKVQTASDLLRSILAYVLTAKSFRAIGLWGVITGIADLADTSWRERFIKSGDWLYWLLNELLQIERQNPSPLLKKAGYERIEIADASHWNLRGKRGKTWRFHCLYSLCSQRLHQVRITSTKVAEGIGNFIIQQGVIYVHDSAYGYRNMIAAISKGGAYAVSAFYPGSFPLEDAEGKAFDLLAWLKKFHAKPKSIKSISLFYQENGQKYEIRIIALKRTPEQRERDLRRKKTNAKRNKSKMQKESLYLSNWLLVLTTLPAKDWTAQEVLSLYRARWQIEILFKRIKQLLMTHVLNGRTEQTIKATVAALLISWVLQQEVAVELRSLLEDMYRELDVSPGNEEEEEVIRLVNEWRVQYVCSDLLRQQVQGPRTRQRVLECMPKLERHFRDSPRKRTQQWHRVTQWLVDPEKSEAALKGDKSRNTGSALTAALA
jgi:hypothetical protein